MVKKNIPVTHIYPSLLAADCMRLADEVTKLQALGVTTLHLDIMDNHYVPNLSFGPHFAKQLKTNFCALKIDVHLMATPVDPLITSFAEAGVSSISIHPEATYHLDRSLNLIHALGCKAGLALNPATPITHIPWIKHQLDFILIMAVNPGFGGQKLIPETMKKIETVTELYPDIEIVVDGGVDTENIQALVNAGAKKFIVGSALFHSLNYQDTLKTLCES